MPARQHCSCPTLAFGTGGWFSFPRMKKRKGIVLLIAMRFEDIFIAFY